MQPNEMAQQLGSKGLNWRDKRPNISLKENGREYRANNIKNKEVFCYRIDGDVIDQIEGQKACDYGLGIPIDDRFVLIELKGGNLDYAIQQIDATIDFLGSKLNDLKIDVHIILSRNRTPDLKGSNFQRLQAKLKKKKNGFLKTHTARCEEIL